MPRITLRAYPSIHRRDGHGASTVSLPFNNLGERTVLDAARLEDIKAAVEQYGGQIASAYPGRSFAVSVHVMQGSRKPRGFDAAERSGGLGTRAWQREVDTTKGESEEAALHG